MRIYVFNFLNIKKATKRIFSVLFAVLTLFSILFLSDKYFASRIYTYASSNISYENVIIIDAGHGGEDSGAIGTNGVYEKNLNLEISLMIGKALADKGYTVVYTRTTDKMLYLPEENVKGIRKISDLKNRCLIANSYKDSTFISIHMNSFGSSKYSGLQVYYKEDEESRVLAENIRLSVKNKVQPSNERQLKKGKDIYILENSNNNAVLIECGFLSNEAECEKLSEKEYQKELSFAIVCGIIESIEEKNK